MEQDVFDVKYILNWGDFEWFLEKKLFNRFQFKIFNKKPMKLKEKLIFNRLKILQTKLDSERYLSIKISKSVEQ
jgi:hypothetical protein